MGCGKFSKIGTNPVDENELLCLIDGQIVASCANLNTMFEVVTLVGRNVNEMVPKYLNKAHRQFMLEYARTGNQTILNRWRIVRARTMLNSIISINQLIEENQDSSTLHLWRYKATMRYTSYKCEAEELVRRMVPPKLADTMVNYNTSKSSNSSSIHNKQDSMNRPLVEIFDCVIVMFVDIKGSTEFAFTNS